MSLEEEARFGVYLLVTRRTAGTRLSPVPSPCAYHYMIAVANITTIYDSNDNRAQRT